MRKLAAASFCVWAHRACVRPTHEQVVYIFPRAGPQLLMTIHMLVDLWHFMLLIGFFTFSFTASLYVLSLNSTDRAVEYASALVADVDDKPQAIFKHLVEAELNAEPMNLLLSLGDFGDQEWCKWAIVCLFGCFAVLLLLNLLIAVFSKSVETISQDLDANFKLKFGQLVMRARGAPLAPRPLHFVRAAILLCYSALGCLGGKRTRGASGEWSDRLLLEVRHLVLGRVSEKEDSGPQSDGIGSDHDVVAAFLERAISKEVRLLPEGIVDSVHRLRILDSGHGHESAHHKQSNGSSQASERTADDDEWRREVSQKLETIGLVNRKLDALAGIDALKEVNKKLELLGDMQQRLDSLTMLVKHQAAGAGAAVTSRAGTFCQRRRTIGSTTSARVAGQADSNSSVTEGDVTVLEDKRTSSSGPTTRRQSYFSKGNEVPAAAQTAAVLTGLGAASSKSRWRSASSKGSAVLRLRRSCTIGGRSNHAASIAHSSVSTDGPEPPFETQDAAGPCASVSTTSDGHSEPTPSRRAAETNPSPNTVPDVRCSETTPSRQQPAATSPPPILVLRC